MHPRHTLSFALKKGSSSGFTLVEMAIVLVIIGLLVAGVLVGRQLIENGKFHKAAAQLTSYQSAITTFRLKYDALPGDMAKAVTYLPSLTTTCVYTTNCYGTGNNLIDSSYEMTMFWAHLSAAKLIPGTYSGAYIHDRVIGVDLPPFVLHENLTIEASVYATWYVSNIPGNYMTIGILPPPGQWLLDFSQSLYAWEDEILDKKLDDGSPVAGKILTWPLWACTDASNNYLPKDSGMPPYCWLFVRIE